jgi:hypothetical protein
MNSKINLEQLQKEQHSVVLLSGRRLTYYTELTINFAQLDLKTREIYWLIGKHSPLSLENKLLIYKTALKPVWT